MLTPELKKLKEKLKGAIRQINDTDLLAELEKLETFDLQLLSESLAMSDSKCPTCGKKL